MKNVKEKKPKDTVELAIHAVNRIQTAVFRAGGGPLNFDEVTLQDFVQICAHNNIQIDANVLTKKPSNP